LRGADNGQQLVVVQVCASAGDALMMPLMAAIRPPANTTANTTVKISFFMARSPERLEAAPK
jgi:hypothetical protein